MAQKLRRPIEDYLIGKHDTGVCCYLITREAYHSWFNHGATVKHSCINYNSGQDLIQYPLQPKAKYKAFEFNKMPIEWQPILTKGNAELAKQLCAYHTKPKGKFDHIKPDGVYFLRYKSMVGNDFTSFIDIETYNNFINSVKLTEYAVYWKDLSPSSLGSGSNNDRIAELWPDISLINKIKLKDQNPELYKYFEDFYAKQAAVKSKPTPDQYYIIKNTNRLYYVVLRSLWDEPASITRNVKEGNSWEFGKFTGLHNRDSSNWPTNNKKFPQLSSEIKAELQKLNPERYKEWEDFYMKKYPNMQPLKPELPTELPNPADNYIVAAGNGLVLVQKSKFINNTEQWVYDFVSGWRYIKVYLENKDANGRSAWPYIKNWKDYTGIKPIYKQFEQYYAELEQKQVAEKQTYNMSDKTPDMFYLYTVGRGWELARREAIDGVTIIPRDTDKVMLIKLTDYSVREVEYKYITQWKPLQFKHLDAAQVKNFHNQNPQLYGEWVHYQTCLNLRGKRAHTVMFEENGPFPKELLQARIDELQSVDSIWGKDLHGKLVNRLIELETMGHPGILWGIDRGFTPKEYYDMVMNSPNLAGIVWIKPRKAGQAKYYGRPIPSSEGIMTQLNNQQFYTPNLKQQNNEIINVPRKIITIASGQKCTGNSISSFRCAPAITEKHIGNRQEPIRGKQSTGCCKVG